MPHTQTIKFTAKGDVSTVSEQYLYGFMEQMRVVTLLTLSHHEWGDAQVRAACT